MRPCPVPPVRRGSGGGAVRRPGAARGLLAPRTPARRGARKENYMGCPACDLGARVAAPPTGAADGAAVEEDHSMGKVLIWRGGLMRHRRLRFARCARWGAPRVRGARVRVACAPPRRGKLWDVGGQAARRRRVAWGGGATSEMGSLKFTCGRSFLECMAKKIPRVADSGVLKYNILCSDKHCEQTSLQCHAPSPSWPAVNS
eukprot:gene22881-biopygen4272